MVNPCTVGSDFTLSLDDMLGHARALQPQDATADAVRKIHAATEDWCAKAAARGEGFRLFRSDTRFERSAEGYVATVDFQILAPGEGAPASGHVFGPWPGYRIAPN